MTRTKKHNQSSSIVIGGERYFAELARRERHYFANPERRARLVEEARRRVREESFFERHPEHFAAQLPCHDCGVPTVEIGEYFMVTSDIWQTYCSDARYLCIGCVETRLGRTLNRWDFTIAPINDYEFRVGMSIRMRERLLAV
jgi:hypothetical protein